MNRQMTLEEAIKEVEQTHDHRYPNRIPESLAIVLQAAKELSRIAEIIAVVVAPRVRSVKPDIL